ncbi:Uncharacterised protein [Candidatus Tiddalikarchaeum anstoanum]|nr:Uncharacterised protein [Candidatus Tiddalikarchaeum anstoanum]
METKKCNCITSNFENIKINNYILVCKHCGFNLSKNIPIHGNIRIEKNSAVKWCLKCPKCNELICEQYISFICPKCKKESVMIQPLLPELRHKLK